MCDILLYKDYSYSNGLAHFLLSCTPVNGDTMVCQSTAYINPPAPLSDLAKLHLNHFLQLSNNNYSHHLMIISEL